MRLRAAGGRGFNRLKRAFGSCASTVAARKWPRWLITTMGARRTCATPSSTGALHRIEVGLRAMADRDQTQRRGQGREQQKAGRLGRAGPSASRQAPQKGMVAPGATLARWGSDGPAMKEKQTIHRASPMTAIQSSAAASLRSVQPQTVTCGAQLDHAPRRDAEEFGRVGGVLEQEDVEPCPATAACRPEPEGTTERRPRKKRGRHDVELQAPACGTGPAPWGCWGSP